MFTIAVTGYVTGEIKVKDGEYGKSGTLSIRVKTASAKSPSHYVNAVFYGKRIETIQKYVADGRLIAVSGPVKSIMHKRNKADVEYVSIYIDCSDFSLPERMSDAPATAQSAPVDDLAF